MDTTQIIIITALLGIIAIGAIIYFVYKNIKNNRFRTLRPSKKAKVTGIVKKYAMINFFKVAENFTFENKGKQHTADYIIAGPFGYIVMNVSRLRGEVYGEAKDKNWLHYRGDDKQTVNNLYADLEETVLALRDCFSKDKIYKMKCYPVVVFIDKKLELFVSDTMPVFKINQLKKYLNRDDFIEKGNANPKELLAQLEKYRIQK